MSIFVLGVALGKAICSLVGLDDVDVVGPRRTIRWSSLMKALEKLGPEVIAMEACCGAHFVGPQSQALGIEVRLMPSAYIKPYVKTNKSDDRDAEAIAEAATRPTMRFVSLKSQEQLDLQLVHRLHDRLVGERTGLINQLRAFLFERGISIPEKKASLSATWARLKPEWSGGDLEPGSFCLARHVARLAAARCPHLQRPRRSSTRPAATTSG